MFNRFVMELLRTRWGLFLCALIAAGVGIVSIVGTVPTHAVRVDGAVASYTVVHNVTGGYDHNELRLSGNPTVYKLDDGEYTPAPPDAPRAGAQVSIWVNQGNVWILAIRLPTAGGSGSRMFTTFPYDHPDQNLLIGRIVGGVFLLLSLALVVVGLAWRHLPWSRGRRRTSSYTPSYTPTYLAPGMYDEDQPRT